MCLAEPTQVNRVPYVLACPVGGSWAEVMEGVLGFQTSRDQEQSGHLSREDMTKDHSPHSASIIVRILRQQEANRTEREGH